MIKVSVSPDPFKFYGDINQRVNTRLARELETRVRARVDPGVAGIPGLEDALATRVAARGNRIVIERKREPTPGEVGLRDRGARSVRDTLFNTIDPGSVTAMKTMEEHTFVDGVMQQLLGFDFPRHLEEAVKELVSERPSEFQDPKEVL